MLPEMWTEGELVEVGIKTAVGLAAYIYQANNAVRLQESDKFVDRMVAMTYRIKLHILIIR